MAGKGGLIKYINGQVYYVIRDNHLRTQLQKYEGYTFYFKNQVTQQCPNIIYLISATLWYMEGKYVEIPKK